MGGHTYWYFVNYQPDIDAALQALRQREFEAGRYNPVIRFPFPFAKNGFALSNERSNSHYPSIEAAIKAADSEGTRSILDIYQTSKSPFPDAEFEALDSDRQAALLYDSLVCKTFPLSNEELLKLFDTEKPTHEMINSVILDSSCIDFWNRVGRGTSRYIVIYKKDEPTEIFFAGCSFD